MYSCCVEEEVRGCLENQSDLSNGSVFSPYVVVDGNLVTGRWPVDVDLFAERVAQAITASKKAGAEAAEAHTRLEHNRQ